MTGSVLVPLDMSHIGEVALPFASWIASGLAADVVLCTVVSDQEHSKEALAESAAHAAIYLERVAGDLRSAGLTVWTQVATGKTADEIAVVAAGESVGFVVLTTFGKGGDARHLGSTASRLSRTLTKPSLFISPSSDVQAPIAGPIFIALDGSAAAEATLEPAGSLAVALKMPIVLIRVAPWARELFAAFVGLAPLGADEEIELGSDTYLANQAQSLQAHGEVEYQTLRGQPAQALIDYVQTAGGMLVMGAQGHSAGHFWGLGGTTDKVLRGAPMPVLVVPIEKSDNEPNDASEQPVQRLDLGAP